MPRPLSPAASGKPINPPFLSARGKRRMADFAVSQAPEAFGAYFEPFLEGGAVAIAMMERFPDAAFHLSGSDPDVVVTWEALSAEVDTLVSLVREHIERHSRAHLAETRAMGAEESRPPAAGRESGSSTLAGLTPLERAARFLYLRGGTDRETVAFDEGNARRVAALLRARDVRFATRHFFSIVSSVAEEDLVFLDPPFGASGNAGSSAAAFATAAAAAGTDASVQAADLVSEVRSLVGTITARGAYVLAPGGPSADASAVDAVPYRAWKTMALAADRGDGETLWANRSLVRVLHRQQ